MYEEVLRKVLTQGETKVYLALLELGSTTVGPIVKKSGVSYSNVYDVLRRLIEKGIVSHILKSKTKYFQAASPNNLTDYLDKKEKEITKQKEAMKEITPSLESLYTFNRQQSAEIFVGQKGLRTAYIKLVADQKDEHLFLYAYEKAYAKESDLFYFSIQKVLKDLKIRGIANEEYKRSEYLKQARYIKMRFTDVALPGNIDVCGGKLLLVTWKKPVTAIFIQSEDLANSMKRYFESMWRNNK